ncbi:matrixin family metalloprotease [archaeon]|jgi:hypothetical protein|nr:matrixin family metalloprotease [archaeon]
MRWQNFLGIIFAVFLILLFVSYMFIPFNDLEFSFDRNTNFSLVDENINLQFYPNMRFPTMNISYEIKDKCNLQKQGDVLRAFEILNEDTILDFYEVIGNGEIKISCEDKNRVEDGLFIAGEGGPTNITESGNFHVITEGEILLIRKSSCEEPNIAIHEILHVLGFNHSNNKNNILYPVSNCKQRMGEEIAGEIDKLYSVPTLPDLSLTSASAIKHGRYLDINFSVENSGLIGSEKAVVIVYADGKKIDKLEVDELQVGHGRKIDITNLWISQLKLEFLELVIETNLVELTKENNNIVLQIKK